MKLRLLVPAALFAGAALAAPASAAPEPCVKVGGSVCVRDGEICWAPNFIPMVEQCRPILQDAR